MPGDCVVDDLAGLLARLPMSLRARHLVPAEVAGEARDPETRWFLEWARDAGLLEVVEAPGVGLEGLVPRRLLERLSPADRAVLALALRLRGECDRVLVATDDYALQEAAALLGLGVVRIRYPGSRALRGARGGSGRG